MVTDPPKRVRLSVPAADVSTIEWLKTQDNISFSIRHLIHDYIEREGYTDPHNKVVAQLPRRGRPPKAESQNDDSVDIHGSVEQSREVVPVEVPVKPSKPASANADQLHGGESQSQHDIGSTEWRQNTSPATPGTEDIGAFFAANRDK